MLHLAHSWQIAAIRSPFHLNWDLKVFTDIISTESIFTFGNLELFPSFESNTRGFLWCNIFGFNSGHHNEKRIHSPGNALFFCLHKDFTKQFITVWPDNIWNLHYAVRSGYIFFKNKFNRFQFFFQNCGHKTTYLEHLYEKSQNYV